MSDQDMESETNVQVTENISLDATSADTVYVSTEQLSPPKSKRRMVDADDNTLELPNKRRGNVELDKGKRDLVLRFVLAAHVRITVVFYGTTDVSLYRNLHLSQQVSSIFCTVHNCLRQNSIQSGDLMRNMKDKSHSLHINSETSKSVKHSVLEFMIKDLAKSFGLEYTKPDEKDVNHWYGTISPIICFINLFKTRLTELRVGHGSFTTKKRDGDTYHVSVSQYGFYPAHHILLEGISLTPERKSGMAQSLGPLTSLIALAKSDPDSKYSKRWKMAVQRNCSFLPEIESVIQVACGKKASECRELFNIIGDILLMTTSREAKRASFPAFMLLMMLDDSEIRHYFNNNTMTTVPTKIDWFNFSGNAAFQLYRKCYNIEWKYSIKPEKAKYLNQIIFHSIWGTFCEDFGILEWMTNYKGWSTRSELDDAFEKIGSQPLTVFQPIPILKYAKLTSANQTGLLSVTSSQVTSRSVFSGKHMHTYTDSFFEYMETTRSNAVAAKKNMETLINVLQNVKVDLLNHAKDQKTQKRGTTDWHSIEGSTNTEYGPVLSEVPSTSGKFYMQAKD